VALRSMAVAEIALILLQEGSHRDWEGTKAFRKQVY
jgi:hypothetical protein